MADKFFPIFFAVLGLTALCGILMGAIAIFGPNPQPAPIAALFETLKYGFTVGMLSIFGLLSSVPRRTSRPKRQDDLQAP